MNYGEPVVRPTKSTKAVVAGVALLSGALTAAFGDDIFDWGELGEFIALTGTTIAGIISVYRVKNNPR